MQEMLSAAQQAFITAHRSADPAQLALQRSHYPELTDSDFRMALQQIDGRRRTLGKLPLFANTEGWLYPAHLALEQCSSEQTARYKALVLKDALTKHSQPDTSSPDSSPFTPQEHRPTRLLDGTGGYGVDTFFLSECCDSTDYVEQNTELAAIVRHNFALTGRNIHCHTGCTDSALLEQWLSSAPASSLPILYLDPARRDSHGGRVFRLGDCTPDATVLVPTFRSMAPDGLIMLKLSPMLDITQAVLTLGGCWHVHIVSLEGEVKEVLLLSSDTSLITAAALRSSDELSTISSPYPDVTASQQGLRTLTFATEDEQQAAASFIGDKALEGLFVYEPDAALLKAGAFKLLSARYGLLKAGINTHLYFASDLTALTEHKLAGRIWQVTEADCSAVTLRTLKRANILTRNYPMSADQLRKKLRLGDGGDEYIIAARINDRPTLLRTKRTPAPR